MARSRIRYMKLDAFTGAQTRTAPRMTILMERPRPLAEEGGRAYAVTYRLSDATRCDRARTPRIASLIS